MSYGIIIILSLTTINVSVAQNQRGGGGNYGGGHGGHQVGGEGSGRCDDGHNREEAMAASRTMAEASRTTEAVEGTADTRAEVRGDDSRVI